MHITPPLQDWMSIVWEEAKHSFGTPPPPRPEGERYHHLTTRSKRALPGCQLRANLLRMAMHAYSLREKTPEQWMHQHCFRRIAETFADETALHLPTSHNTDDLSAWHERISAARAMWNSRVQQLLTNEKELANNRLKKYASKRIHGKKSKLFIQQHVYGQESVDLSIIRRKDGTLLSDPHEVLSEAADQLQAVLNPPEGFDPSLPPPWDCSTFNVTTSEKAPTTLPLASTFSHATPTTSVYRP